MTESLTKFGRATRDAYDYLADKGLEPKDGKSRVTPRMLEALLDGFFAGVDLFRDYGLSWKDEDAIRKHMARHSWDGVCDYDRDDYAMFLRLILEAQANRADRDNRLGLDK